MMTTVDAEQTFTGSFNSGVRELAPFIDVSQPPSDGRTQADQLHSRAIPIYTDIYVTYLCQPQSKQVYDVIILSFYN